MRTIKKVPEMPQYIHNFVQSIEDINLLCDSHIQSLITINKKKLNKKELIISEQPTIYIKSALIVLSSTWEAFIEDLIEFAFTKMIDICTDSDLLPKLLKKEIIKNLSKSKNELELWKLTAAGWKDSAKELVKEELAKLNSPYIKNIDMIFSKMFGIKQFSACLTWDVEYQNEVRVFSTNFNTEMITDLVNIRNSLAHGRKADFPVPISLKLYNILKNIIVNCAFIMNNSINKYISDTYGGFSYIALRSNIDFSEMFLLANPMLD